MTQVKSSRSRGLADGEFRDAYMRAAVLGGAVLVAMTEGLGAIHGLSRAGAIAAAILIATTGGIVLFRRCSGWPRLDWINALLVAGIVVILGVVGFIAILSPPNAADAMAYHMPRVLFWSQQRSVDFFATPYLNQITLQPFAEYFMLHLYLLEGGDRLVNLVQWFGCVTSVTGVSLIALHFGAGRRGQILAAVFCVTLPNGILQASGAKNDYLLAAWLVAAAWFFLDDRVILAGLALGLAMGTKATAYIYAPPLIVAIVILHWDWWRSRALAALSILVCALALNLPQFGRNIDLSGSPLGFDGAFGDGRFRWRNETLGWRQTASNLIRNITEQLGGSNTRWNQSVYEAALRMHRLIRADPMDPATTWLWAKYEPPRYANHEVNAPNRWHLLILTVCFAVLPWRSRVLLLYATALIAGFVLFCFYLKWQPFMARMFLPLFVLASPIAGVLGEQIRPAVIQIVLCLSLFNNARPFLLENWVRPLKGARSLLRTSRDGNYFSDMTQWNNRETYLQAVDEIAGLRCATVGVDINDLQLEYPIEALLLERNRDIRFVHTGVTGPAARYGKPSDPCVVLCLDCGGDPARLEAYRRWGPPRPIGRFLLFTK